MLNIVLDNDVVLELLSKSTNDTQYSFIRLQKSPIRFWLPCCLLSLLETQIYPTHHQPLSTLLNKNVQWLSSLAAHWEEIPTDCPNKTQALMSLDAAILPGTTIIWTNHSDFLSIHPDIEWGDHEFVYSMLAQYENEASLLGLANQQLILRPQLEKHIFNVLKHGQYIVGTEVENLENELAAYVDVQHCISVTNASNALLIALMAINIKPGDEVITSSFNSIATASMITWLGAKLVFVDIEPSTYALNPTLLGSAITPKTKAIVVANVFGQCADFNAINEIANQHDLVVIEDATQSCGATYHSLKSGTLATISYTSFSPYQVLSAYGDGGACFTNDEELANRMRQLRNFGQDQHNHCSIIGISSRLDTLQASLLLAKLKVFPQELESRTQIAANYTRLLKGKLKTPIIASHNTSVYTQYIIEIDNRENVQQQLQKRDIPTAVPHLLPLHLQPIFAKQGESHFPVTETVAPRVLSIPMHPYLTEEIQTQITKALINVS